MSGLTGDISASDGLQGYMTGLGVPTQGARFEAFFHAYSCISPQGLIRTSYVDANSEGPGPVGRNHHTILERSGSKGKISPALAAHDAAAYRVSSRGGSRRGSREGKGEFRIGRSTLSPHATTPEGSEDMVRHTSPSARSGCMPSSSPPRLTTWAAAALGEDPPPAMTALAAAAPTRLCQCAGSLLHLDPS